MATIKCELYIQSNSFNLGEFKVYLSQNGFGWNDLRTNWYDFKPSNRSIQFECSDEFYINLLMRYEFKKLDNSIDETIILVQEKTNEY